MTEEEKRLMNEGCSKPDPEDEAHVTFGCLILTLFFLLACLVAAAVVYAIIEYVG